MACSFKSTLKYGRLRKDFRKITLHHYVPLCFSGNQITTICQRVYRFVEYYSPVLIFIIKKKVGTEHQIKIANDACGRRAQFFIEQIEHRKVDILFQLRFNAIDIALPGKSLSGAFKAHVF